MAQRSAREIALAALRLWRKQKRFADSIISGLLAEAELSLSDRAFALELFYGVLRNLTLLDFWIARLRGSRIESDVRDNLRLGLYQLFLLKTPEHAAVYESVATAPRTHRPIINAILRTATRRRRELLAEANAQPLSLRMSHPQFLVERWEQQFGPEHTNDLCEWNNQPAPIFGRINRLKIDPDSFLRQYPNSLPLTDNLDFMKFNAVPTEALNFGHCNIQDPSTAIACQLLDPKPGEKVLDACAAPGGKATYLAQFMQNRGVIVACDRDIERLQILKGNVARLGATIVHTLRHDWARADLPKEILSIAPFDRILLDAPCTNTGVMRRRVDVRWRLRREDFERLPGEQLRIFGAVLPLLKAGGVFVYSTCSLEPEENERLVERALGEFPFMRPDRQREVLPFRDRFDGAFAVRLCSQA
ncbi:MAG TPA: 16S rRNA (cytosine(967)-C(5))-methyltransferase RsmB [Candidatus Udaeobacter sp.]|jgi:16S rRNA (cytosine967-C5)-methyltransferase|nr:16S rRNA (cytosine(967)-C(5))-methyltransferase RsmB [Candidatus Udaeobacter sp.]